MRPQFLKLIKTLATLGIFVQGALSMPLFGNSASVKVLKVESASGGLALTTALRAAPADALSYRVKDATGKTQTVATSALPMNLWILVDTSSLCTSFKMDKYLSGVFSKLSKALSAETLVTIMSYTQDSKAILANHVAASTLEDFKIDCQSDALSASFDGALSQLLAGSEKNNLPTQVWVYSSGNVVLGSNTVKALETRDVTLNVTLYVPMVFTEMQPLLNASAKALGDKYSYSVLKQDPKTGVVLPEIRLQSQYNPPLASQGATTGFKFEVLRTGKEPSLVASTSFQALVPKSWFSIFTGPEFKIFLIFLMLYGIYRLVKSYQPRHCKTCKHALKFTDEQCAFCQNVRDPSLVVVEQGAKDAQASTLALPNGSATLYRSRYGLDTTGSKSQALVKIEKREHAGLDAFAVSPFLNNIEDILGENSAILVNGKALRSPRFLANGDTLQIGNRTVSFLSAEKTGKSGGTL